MDQRGRIEGLILNAFRFTGWGILTKTLTEGNPLLPGRSEAPRPRIEISAGRRGLPGFHQKPSSPQRGGKGACCGLARPRPDWQVQREAAEAPWGGSERLSGSQTRLFGRDAAPPAALPGRGTGSLGAFASGSGGPAWGQVHVLLNPFPQAKRKTCAQRKYPR